MSQAQTDLKIGDRAPDFSLATNDGKIMTLKNFKGKSLILYFYPKDDTPGCTTQARAFTEAHPRIRELGAEVLGVSADTVEKHAKFIAKHQLSIPLGSDPEHEALTAYGVWVEKNMYGRKYMGIERSTFIINPKGQITHIWRKVKVKNHIDEVLTALA